MHRGGSKPALPGVGVGGVRGGAPLPRLRAHPSAVPSRAPQCQRRGQAGPREQVGSQRQDPRALETAAVHKPRPTLLLRAHQHPGGRGRSGRLPVSGGRPFGILAETSQLHLEAPAAGSPALRLVLPPTLPGVLDPGAPCPAPRKAGRSSEHGPRAMTRGPLSLNGRKGDWMSGDGETKGNKTK